MRHDLRPAPVGTGCADLGGVICELVPRGACETRAAVNRDPPQAVTLFSQASHKPSHMRASPFLISEAKPLAMTARRSRDTHAAFLRWQTTAHRCGLVQLRARTFESACEVSARTLLADGVVFVSTRMCRAARLCHDALLKGHGGGGFLRLCGRRADLASLLNRCSGAAALCARCGFSAAAELHDAAPRASWSSPASTSINLDS